MLKLNAVLTCDECGVSVDLEDVTDTVDVWTRMRHAEALWGEDEDGRDLCPKCQSDVPAQAADAVVPGALGSPQADHARISLLPLSI